MFQSNYSKIDLHGFDQEYASICVKEFINDNYQVGNRHVLIIHGKGTGLLRKRIHLDLKKNKKVLSFQLNMFNDGETLVTLKERN